MPPILICYSRRRRALRNGGEISMPRTPNINHEPKRFVYEDDDDEEHIMENMEDDAEDNDEYDKKQDVGCGAKLGESETKCRKAVLKLGMKPVLGVQKATIRKNDNFYIHITEPEVFKSPTAESYVKFGAAKRQNRGPIAKKHAKQAIGHCPKHGSSTMAHEEYELDDETRLDPKDIELIMQGKGHQGTEGGRK